MRIIKVGGSLANSPLLADWLAAIADGVDIPTVVVPGGGPFADAVRKAQGSWGLDDGTAHRMALLAMEQYGLMLSAIEPRLCIAATLRSISKGQEMKKVPVWSPSTMTLGQPEIPMNWDVTSDSLAAWLAVRLGADTLVLVKSTPPPVPHTVSELCRQGFLDVAFPSFCPPDLAVWCADSDHPESLSNLQGPGIRIDTMSFD